MTAPLRPPPGWYPDPSGASGQRYFDGNDWTEHRAGQSAPPPTPSGRTAPPSAQEVPTGQPQVPATPDVDPATDAGPGGLQGNEPTSGNRSATDANDNSEKTSAPPQEQGRLRRWRNGLRAAAPTKSTTITVTALIGFLFGIASNQVTDFVKCADDCSDALSQYSAGIISGSYDAVVTNVYSDPEKREKGIETYNTDIRTPYNKVYTKCPMSGKEFLDKNDVKQFISSSEELFNCFLLDNPRQLLSNASPCNVRGGLATLITNVTNSASKLIPEANEVSKWGVVRRGEYAAEHLY
jgi:hypothetical protein